MLKSMTGFGSKETTIASLGKVNLELRSTNHKFLDIVLHLPEGFLSLEERIKKEIEAKIKRGRLTCVITIVGGTTQNVFINKKLLQNYLSAIRDIKDQFQIKDQVQVDTLIHLPGILSLVEDKTAKSAIWPQIRLLVGLALEELVKTRQKEGQALCNYLKGRTKTLRKDLEIIKMRFKKATKKKGALIKIDEERMSFLKDTDISEEIQRLSFHIRNFSHKLSSNVPVGKELDFIAQEMQREANTMAAKSFDAAISVRVVQVKSQIEKIREQVQNVE